MNRREFNKPPKLLTILAAMAGIPAALLVVVVNAGLSDQLTVVLGALLLTASVALLFAFGVVFSKYRSQAQ